MARQIRYAVSDDLHIAYDVFGSGPRDLVLVHGYVTNLELLWDYPPTARALERLASFARVIHFDKRGTGLSDRVPAGELPTLEQRMDDVRAVMHAAGSERAVLVGHSEGGPMCALFAATFPERAEQLVIYGGYAARRRSPHYPWAPADDERAATIAHVRRSWGIDTELDSLAPSRAHDPALRDWWGRFLRSSASPSAAAALTRMNTEVDVRAVLPTIGVPTLIVHRRDDRDVPVGAGRHLAAHIPGARYVELPGADHMIWADPDPIVDAIEEFVTGTEPGVAADRMLTTIMFSDIVASTSEAARVGDRAWRQALDRHDALIQRNLDRHRGQRINTTGDGVVATFDGPARAVRCALAITEDVRGLGLQVRCGVHTGEVTARGDDIGGLAVHIAARVTDVAGPGEVVVTRTVTDLVAGSGQEFDALGARSLKGVPGVWQLMRARGAG